MSAPSDHNRVLRDAARKALLPLGLTQKGRSRTWLDDRIWHLIVVEFQPSGRSKGSYLNVGAMWLWHAKDYFSFDYGSRVREFEGAGSDDWEATAASLAETAAKRVNEIRAELSDIPAAARVLSRNAVQPGWPTFDAAIALGLVGEVDRARGLFERVAANPSDPDWMHDLSARAAQLRSALGDPATFRTRVIDEIQASRHAHRLPDLGDADVQISLDANASTGITDRVRRLLRAD